MLLKRLYHYGLEVKAITKLSVDKTFRQYPTLKHTTIDAIHPEAPLEKHDKELIQSVQWLFVEMNQDLDALLYVNAIYRRFFCIV